MRVCSSDGRQAVIARWRRRESGAFVWFLLFVAGRGTEFVRVYAFALAGVRARDGEKNKNNIQTFAGTAATAATAAAVAAASAAATATAAAVVVGPAAGLRRGFYARGMDVIALARAPAPDKSAATTPSPRGPTDISSSCESRVRRRYFYLPTDYLIRT